MKYFEKNGYRISASGLGTTQFWTGGTEEAAACLIKAVREYGVSLIDTAEMYGHGTCERVLGRLMKETGRDNIFLVGKILPENMTKSRFRGSLTGSLERLGTDRIDLYLLHWRGDTDLAVLAEEMELAKKEGLIGEWGVSNFDTRDLKDLFAVPGGTRCFCNQIYCSVFERGCETELLPFMKEHDVFPMAYSALGSPDLPRPDIRKNRRIMRFCEEYGLSPESLMLAFLQEAGFAALFSTSSLAHLETNLIEVPDEARERLRAVIDEEYPAPSETYPLVKI